MLDSIFIAVLFVTVIFQLVAIYEKSIVFSVFTTMMWLYLMANSLYIEAQPYYSQVYNVSSTEINITQGTYSFMDRGLGVLFLGFVFINIVWAIVQFMDYQKKKGMP